MDNPHYLGPVIVAQRNVPTRIKFTNFLPTGAGGNLFIPTDTTVMGAGMGPLGARRSSRRAGVALPIADGAAPRIRRAGPRGAARRLRDGRASILAPGTGSQILGMRYPVFVTFSNAEVERTGNGITRNRVGIRLRAWPKARQLSP